MEKEIVKEIIREFAMDIADLKRDVESWKKKYFDLFAEQDLFVKQKEQEQHLNVGPSYEEMENALLTEQEHNGNLTKEVDRLTAILKERDAEIARLREFPSDVDTEQPNREACHVMGDPQTVEAPVEAVARGRCCGDCRHAVATDNSENIHCCLREVDYSAYSLGCGSFNSKHARRDSQESKL